MNMITAALKNASKRKEDGECYDYIHQVLTSPPPKGSYSFDGVFYYVSGAYREDSAKRRKVEETKVLVSFKKPKESPTAISLPSINAPKSSSGKSVGSSSSGPTMKKTELKKPGYGKNIRRLEELRNEELSEHEARGKSKDQKDERKNMEKEVMNERDEDEEIFVPKWDIRTNKRVQTIENFEEYLARSVLAGEAIAYRKLSRLEFESAWI